MAFAGHHQRSRMVLPDIVSALFSWHQRAYSASRSFFASRGVLAQTSLRLLDTLSSSKCHTWDRGVYQLHLRRGWHGCQVDGRLQTTERRCACVVNLNGICGGRVLDPHCVSVFLSPAPHTGLSRRYHKWILERVGSTPPSLCLGTQSLTTERQMKPRQFRG